MIYGNDKSQEIVKKIIFSDEYKSNFIILSGPSNIGKSYFAKTLSKEILGNYFNQDFLYIRDLTRVLGKKHSIKVGNDNGSYDNIQVSESDIYADIGVRDIIYRLQQSSVSGKKILLIENIDRMTISACNSFLKSAEEIMKGRIILATTDNHSQIMDTMLSRAIVINFDMLSNQDMLDYMDNNTLFDCLDKEKKDLLIYMAMGKPGLLDQLMNDIDQDILDLFSKTMVYMLSDDLQSKYSRLIQLNKLGYLQVFLDAWINKCINENLDLSDKWLNLQKNMKTNVNIDRMLLDAVL